MNRSTKTPALYPIAFLIFVPIIAHLLYSWMGFNPTDDGFTLAYSRRLAEGQLPHLDFIIVRPFLSPLLHVPLVLWGGGHALWISRYVVWLQFAGISLLWVAIINRLLRQPFTRTEKTLFALIIFVVSSHNFPIIAWHTIDGLLFASAGLWFCIRPENKGKLAGYFLLGVACTCKQNFGLFIPLTLVILGDWRKVHYWLIALLPGVAYVVILAGIGALPAAIVQLGSQTDLLSTGLIKYLRRWTPLGMLIGWYSLHLLRDAPVARFPVKDAEYQRRLGLSGLYWFPIAGVAISLVLGYLFKSSFILYGLLAGLAVYAVRRRAQPAPGAMRAINLVLAAAWAVSISLGYNTPVLLAGQILVLLLAAHRLFPDLPRPAFVKGGGLIAVTIVLVLCQGYGRCAHIYREQPAWNLSYSLADVFPGAEKIRTNSNTYASLADLQTMVQNARDAGRGYAILPGIAGYWAFAPELNPLPVDWVFAEELNDPRLVRWVIETLDTQRETNDVIVQKLVQKRLAERLQPVADDEFHEVIRYVRGNYTKIAETQFHEVYR